MKIAVFENEYDTLEVAFKYANKKFYNNLLQIDNFPRSQSIGDIQKLKEYDLIIIDLDLSSQSELDGFGLIRLIESSIIPIPRILILTGQELESNFDEVNNLQAKYKILKKSINYRKIKTVFDEMGLTA